MRAFQRDASAARLGPIMHGSYPRRTKAPDYPWGPTEQEHRAGIEQMQREWGGPFGLSARAPSVAGDKRFSQWWARMLRMSASPAAAAVLVAMNAEIDIRHILPAIRVPTLLLHSVGDAAINIGASRYMADRIPGARLVELPGQDHLVWLSDADAILGEIEEFLTGVRRSVDPDRVLATVLFTDIVGATEKAAALGDRRWHDLLDSHHESSVPSSLDFEAARSTPPATDFSRHSMVQPARYVVRGPYRIASNRSDFDIRAGLHTGECEVMGEDIGGIVVHIGARIAALAAPGEVLVSSTVKDSVAGSGLSFLDHGAKPSRASPTNGASIPSRTEEEAGG